MLHWHRYFDFDKLAEVTCQVRTCFCDTLQLMLLRRPASGLPPCCSVFCSSLFCPEPRSTPPSKQSFSLSQVTRNLNRIIDVNYYPVETARRSNMRHRPIGMGVQVSTFEMRLCQL